MNLIPMDSKQIAYVAYDDRSSQMTVHYHSGEVRTFPSIQRNDYDEFLYASNKYDAFVNLVVGNLKPSHSSKPFFHSPSLRK